MIGKRLSHLFKHGKLVWLGEPLYTLLVKAELFAVRLFDGRRRSATTPRIDAKLTAVIKTFERPETARRLLRSMRRLYPGLRVLVADDSRNPSAFEGAETIVLPYDSGVSAGRQKALEAVKTPYLLLLDDDFVFYRKTALEAAIEAMESHPEIDIMGGAVINLPSYRAFDYAEASLHPTDAAPLRPAGTEVGGFRVYDKVPNFYIARTERLKLVGWDERIKRLDHADFFTRARGVLLTVFNPSFKVLHAQTPFNRPYMQKRTDLAMDRVVLFSKYYKKTPKE